MKKERKLRQVKLKFLYSLVYILCAIILFLLYLSDWKYNLKNEISINPYPLHHIVSHKYIGKRTAEPGSQA